MTGLDDLLKRILPHDVAFAGGAIERADDALFDVERLAVDGAVAKRRREFSAGRTYARAALAAFASPAQPIPPDADRCPQWPAGFIGSISHCDHLCVAIVGRSASYAGLGIDIEDEGPVEDGVRDMVCRADELHQAAFHRYVDATKILFVAKEAVFKAYYPMTRAFLDFQDVAVVLDEYASSFRAELIAPGKPVLAGEYSFLGRIGRAEGHLLAAVAVTAKAPPEIGQVPRAD